MNADASRSYRDLQRLARATGRGTQELLDLYVHERFLARLAASRYKDQFVLKGGLLLTVLDVRRPTRDVDLMARALSNDSATIETTVAEIASLDGNDGIVFDIARIDCGAIREDGRYGARRVKMPVALSTAKLRLQLDISVGDPVEPRSVNYVELLGGRFTLLGYPIEQVLAEKVATMVARGDTNTRDRDWADVYLLAQRHDVPAKELGKALEATSAHRGHELRPLAEVIRTLPGFRQRPWTAFRARAGLEATTPELFQELFDAVSGFVDPILLGRSDGRWDPRSQQWNKS